MFHVTLQADVDGLPVMPLAFYAGETNMEVPNLAEFSASDDGAGVEAELVDPRWLLTARVTSLGYDDFMVLEGWVQRVRTIHAGRFLGFDPRRRATRGGRDAHLPAGCGRGRGGGGSRGRRTCLRAVRGAPAAAARIGCAGAPAMGGGRGGGGCACCGWCGGRRGAWRWRRRGA